MKEGQRVLFHILNGSATENIQLALSGHRFQVLITLRRARSLWTCLNWVPTAPHFCDRGNEETLGCGCSAHCTMTPTAAMAWGSLLEYANRPPGPARWVKPERKPWTTRLFGNSKRGSRIPLRPSRLAIGKINGGKGGFNRWTINGPHLPTKAAEPRYPKEGEAIPPGLRQSDRRLATRFHLHRNSFRTDENVGPKPTAGDVKDVVLLKGYWKIAVDFVPLN